jgi:hypothetical protein
VTGDALVAQVRGILREGNVRRIAIKNEGGRTLIEVPLTPGVLSVVLMPVWAALGAIGALVTRCSIIVEHVEVPEQASWDELFQHKLYVFGVETAQDPDRRSAIEDERESHEPILP